MERLTPISRPTAEILLALFKKHSAELNSQIWTFLGELEDDEYREAKLLIAYVMVEHFWRGMTPNLVFKRPANETAEEGAKTARAARRAADLANVAALRKLGYKPNDEQVELEQIMGTDLTPDLHWF